MSITDATKGGIYSPRIIAIARERGITELQAYRAEKARETLLARLREQRFSYRHFRRFDPSALTIERI